MNSASSTSLGISPGLPRPTAAEDPRRGGRARAAGETTDEAVRRAMWEGDLDTLNELAGCGCCCADHFFEDCPARVWGGCRGQHSLTRADYAAWEDHYRRHHGLSRDQFYGLDPS